jgi:hypothetical protein
MVTAGLFALRDSMAPTMRNVTADFSSFAALADAETPSAVSVTFTLNQTIGADGDLALRGESTFATDNEGILDVWLVVPDDADTGAPYTCYLPSNEQFSFVLAQGSAIDLLELWVLATVPVASLAEALLATYTPLATFTAHAALVGDATLGHVKNGGNVTINADGTMDASGGGVTQQDLDDAIAGLSSVMMDADDALQVDINTRLTEAQADLLYEPLTTPAVTNSLLDALTACWSGFAGGTLEQKVSGS